ncbi:hypothetical protein [Massilia sp. TSP1-1-2]|uniref:hypothetical protein n=1 Tax=Massilia sp. TSP1-1-2 TaxID=2804649 RepID=UPI003CF24F06
MSTAILKPMRHAQAYLLVMAIFLVYWICMLVFDAAPGRPLAAASTVLMLPVMGTMFWVARFQSAQLARALVMLGERQSPRRLRQSLIRGTSMRLALTWAFLSAGIGLQFQLPHSPYTPLSGAALVSLTACLGLLRGAPGTGRGSMALARLLEAAPWLAGVAVLIGGVDKVLAGLDGLPPLLLAGCVLLFPALLLGTQLQRERGLQSYRSQPKRTGGLHLWFGAQLRRWTILGWDQNGIPGPASTAALLTQRVLQIGMPLALLTTRPVAHDGVLDLARLGGLAMGAAFISCSLLMRDLHLRELLVPGGLRRGRIATRIFGFTFAAQLLLMLAAYALLGAWLLGRGVSSSLLLANLLGYWPRLLELALMTSGALVLAGRYGPARIKLVGGIYCVSLLFSPSLDASMHVRVAPLTYAICTLAASALLLWFANRTWTTGKLFGRYGQRPGFPSAS